MSVSDFTNGVKRTCLGIVGFMLTPAGALWLASEIALSVNGCNAEHPKTNEADKIPPAQTAPAKISTQKTNQVRISKIKQIHVAQR